MLHAAQHMQIPGGFCGLMLRKATQTTLGFPSIDLAHSICTALLGVYSAYSARCSSLSQLEGCNASRMACAGAVSNRAEHSTVHGSGYNRVS